MNSNNFFTLTNVRKVFGWLPSLNGKAETAVRSTQDHFTGIATIMSEIGGQSELANELAPWILADLYGIQQRVNSYVTQVTQAKSSY